MDQNLDELELFSNDIVKKVVNSEEGQMRLTAGKDEKWPVKEEIVAKPMVKVEMEDEEMWRIGGCAKRGNPDFAENLEPKRSKLTPAIEANNYFSQKEPKAEVKEEAKSFPFVVEQSVTPKSIQTGANLPVPEEESVRGSFNVHDLFSNEAAVKEEEGESQNAADERKSCPVDGCLEKLPSYPDLVEHMKIHPNPVICGCCRKSFARAWDLRRHYFTQSWETPFVCITCDKKFWSNSDLVKHTRIHTGEKPFACITCNKQFKGKSDLIRTCDKKFWSNSDLVKHTRIHTGEKPFACITCNKQFKGKSDLIRHTRTHSGETPYLCPSCGKRFKTSGDLTRHSRIHTGEKPFACKNCEYRAAQSTHLKAHQKKYDH